MTYYDGVTSSDMTFITRLTAFGKLTELFVECRSSHRR